MKDLIEQQIKELYESKAAFCEKNDYAYKDFASKLRTFETKFNWLNTFLKPLRLRVTITSIEG